MKKLKRTASRLCSGRLKVEWSGKGAKIMKAIGYLHDKDRIFANRLIFIPGAFFFYFVRELLYICKRK